ncbi:sag-related sequence srs11, partial [Cystoisospora suis]
MKISLRRGADFTLIALAALGLAVLFPLGVESSGARQGLAASPGAEATPEVRECGKEAGAVGENKLELTAKKGQSVQFKCATTYTLSPEDGASQNTYTKTYKVSGSGGCDTNTSINLTEVVSDGELTKSEGKVAKQGSAPVYTFLYNSPQTEKKILCYRCNPPTSGDGDTSLSPKAMALGSDAEGKTPCTVLITVPKDEATPVTT